MAKTQDIRNAPENVIMLPQELWVILIWALSKDPHSIENLPSARRVDSVSGLVPVAFGNEVCLMSGSMS